MVSDNVIMVSDNELGNIERGENCFQKCNPMHEGSAFSMRKTKMMVNTK